MNESKIYRDYEKLTSKLWGGCSFWRGRIEGKGRFTDRDTG